MICIPITTLALLVACELQGESPYLTKPLIRAAVSGGHVFVSPNRRSWDAPAWNGEENVDLVYQDLARTIRPVAHINPAAESKQFPRTLHRWHVDRTRFHYLSYDTWDNSGVEPLRQRFGIGWSPLTILKSMTVPEMSAFDGVARLHLDQTSRGVHDAGPPGWQTAMLMRLTPWDYGSVLFDFLPAADGQYEWYVSAPGPKGLSNLIRWDSSPSPERIGKPKWTEKGSWTPLLGEFYVVASGKDRYFVTGNDGHIFAAPRGGKPGDPLKEVWKESPVALLLHDADAGKSYAFTKEHYFEITDPIKPKPHAVTFRFPINRAWDAHKALDTAAKCGRVIRRLPEPK